jgi:hypothetical protein
MPTDQPYPSPDDPVVRAASSNDIPANTRHLIGGDVWFDVVDPFEQDIAWDTLNRNHQDIAWDILNVFLQTISFDILNENFQDIAWDIPRELKQDIAWSIFPAVLFFIAQFHAKVVAFDFKTADGETLEEQYNLIAALKIKTPVQFTYQIKQPVTFTFGIDKVLSGEYTTKNRRG